MDQTTMTGEPPMTGTPQKKGWGWLKWTLLGCGGLLAIVLVIGSLGAWFLYRNFSMTTEPAKAEAAAQEILRFEKPEGYTGLMAGRAVVIPGARNNVLAFAVRLMPRAVVRRMVRRIQDHRAAPA